MFVNGLQRWETIGLIKSAIADIWSLIGILGGFSGSSAGKESASKAGDPLRFLGWEDPLEKG